jgi:hypothetical protein
MEMFNAVNECLLTSNEEYFRKILCSIGKLSMYVHDCHATHSFAIAKIFVKYMPTYLGFSNCYIIVQIINALTRFFVHEVDR